MFAARCLSFVVHRSSFVLRRLYFVFRPFVIDPASFTLRASSLSLVLRPHELPPGPKPQAVRLLLVVCHIGSLTSL